VLTPDVVFPQSVFYINFKRHMKPAYLHQWNLSLQRQVGNDWMVAANCIGTSSIHGQSGTEANPAIFLPGASCVINGRTFTPLLVDWKYQPAADFVSGKSNSRPVLRQYHAAWRRKHIQLQRAVDFPSSAVAAKA
jgi:hypothetical protein